MTRFVKPYLFTFCCLLTLLKAAAQEIQFTNQQQWIQLPSEECYDVMQDPKGFIWVSTEKGIVRFSGTTQRQFLTSHNATEGSVYAMCTLPDSGQLMITSRLQVLQTQADSLQQASTLTQWIRKLEKENTRYKSLFYQVQAINRSRYILHDQWRSYSFDANTHKPLAHQQADVQYPDAMYLINMQDSIPYYIKHPSLYDSAIKTTIQKEVTIVLRNRLEGKRIELPLDAQDYVNWRTVYAQTNKRFFFGVNNKLLVVNRDLSYQLIQLPKRLISLYIDPHQGLWIGLVTGGGYYFPDAHQPIDLNKGTQLLSDLSVSGFCEDREGNVWCTTLEKGLFYAASPEIRYYRESALADRHVYFLRHSQQEIFTSSRIDELYSIGYGHMQQFNLPVHQNFEISDVYQQGNIFYMATKGFLYQFYRTPERFQLMHSEPVALYEISSTPQHAYGISRGSLVEIGDGFHRRVMSLPTKAYCLLVKDDRWAYVGGADGLFLADLQQKTSEKIKNCTVPVSRLLLSKTKDLYLTTYGNGFGKLTGDRYVRLSGDSIPDGFNDLTEDRYGTIWLASRQGLYQYHPTTKIFRLLNRSNGLLSDNIYKLAADDQSLFVSTTDGLCVFPLQQSLFNSLPPTIQLSQFQINGKSIDNRDYQRLSYQENNFRWAFDVFSFKRGGKEGIWYQLANYDSGFVFSKEASISYRHLEPGNYRLTVYAVNNNGVRSKEPLVYRFTIDPPFWKTTIFYIGAAIGCLGLMALLGWLIIRRIKTKEKEKTKMHQLIADSRLSALQAQMNPHFIFNSINSIQNYILDKNEQQAYDYLSKFSKLIRLVLVNSRQKVISLQDELETLRLYVDLEKLRFDHAFDFNIHLPDNLAAQEIMIPSMLIQPFVENAIWHGLMNLKETRRGQLSLYFETTDQQLKIIVEDNGVGRAYAAQFKSKHVHQSEGLNITNERIELINKMNQTTGNAVRFIDKTDSAGQSLGTRVEITINTQLYEK